MPAVRGRPGGSGADPVAPVWWGTLVTVPLVLLALILLWPSLDGSWQHEPAHFWLVLAASVAAVALGYAVSGAARRRRDARLFLVSLGFIVSAGFLGLHALATPGVLVGPNPGFELATPVGLLVGGGFVAASSLDLTPAQARRVNGLSRPLLGACLLLIVSWGVVSLAGLPPLDDPLLDEELDGWQNVLGVIGVASYLVASAGYFRLWRRRRARFALSVAVAFLLLAEAMVVIAVARNWQISWWEWHLLMLTAYVVIAQSARAEWHQERFSALYLDQTLAGAQEASVLFADLQDYTSYAERNSPAETARMLNSYFERLVPLMEAQGGEVYQLIGDAMMVVFNKDGGQPGHASQAARAGLVLQQQAELVAAAHPDWPRFRVGVNSGRVMAGVLGGPRGHRTHGLVGDMVNLAARLEAEASAGTVLVGSGTYERLPRGADADRLPPMKVKGKEEVVTAYVLHALPD